MPDTLTAELPAVPAPIDPDQPCFLRAPVKCLPTIIQALQAAGYKKEAKAVEEFTRDYTDPAANAERERWLALADTEDGEVEVDPDGTISHSGDSGEYVLAWLWVDAPEDDTEDEDQDAD